VYDRDIRAALVRQLEAAGVRVVHEWAVGGCVVDVAAITERLHGYEIKGPRDSLARLQSQVEAYSGPFDRCTLISTVHYLDTAEERGILPAWWGTVAALEDAATPGGIKLVRVREPRQNPNQRAGALAWVCYARELRAILQRRCLPYRSPPYGYMGKPAMVRTAAENIPVDELRPEVLRMLEARPYWKKEGGGRRSGGLDTVKRLEIDGRPIGPIAR
jgi:hypothetical protein